MFSTNHALKFKYQPSHLKVNNSNFLYKGPIFANLSLYYAWHWYQMLAAFKNGEVCLIEYYCVHL